MTDPISFDPFLGWVDATDPDNLPEDVRIIEAADLLRYENFGVAAETAVNGLITEVNALSEPPAWADITGKPTTFAPATHTHTGADIDLATTSLPGAMSAADKLKLDNATSTVTVNRLAIRDSEGRLQAMTPESDYDLATKAYVDTNIGAVGADSGWITVPLEGTWTHSFAFGSTGLKVRVKNGIVFLNGRIENVNSWVQGQVICDDITALHADITAPTSRAIGVNCAVNSDDYAIVLTAGGPGSLLLNCTWPTG